MDHQSSKALFGSTNNLRPNMNPFQSSLGKLRVLVSKLENSEDISDQQLKSTYHEFAGLMLTNCDSAAQGFFTTAAEVCYYRQNLAPELFTYAMQSLYYLGFEELDDIKRYILWLLSAEKLYLGHPSTKGVEYLQNLLEQNDTIINAFRMMYEMEDNEWRKEDTICPDMPPILC